jgi:hypothetical protein
VEVAPGLAYDAFGRELILAAPATLTVPEGPSEVEPRVLVLSQGAELEWMPASQVRALSGVPLARVTYDGGQAAADETFRAPAARPFARPKLGYGSTIAGATEWEIWDLEIGHRFLLGLQITLDTRAAGFTEPPCYFAWLQGGIEHRLKPEEPGVFLPLYSHLAATTLTSFRFRVITVTLGTAVGSGGRTLLLSIARRQLSVCWLGIQMPSGETPLPEVIHGHP